MPTLLPRPVTDSEKRPLGALVAAVYAYGAAAQVMRRVLVDRDEHEEEEAREGRRVTMRSILNESDRGEIVRRMQSLSESSTRRWGEAGSGSNGFPMPPTRTSPR